MSTICLGLIGLEARSTRSPHWTAYCSTDVRVPRNDSCLSAMGGSAHGHTNGDRHMRRQGESVHL